MDANGLRFWLLADEAHWPWRVRTAWHGDCSTLRLASERELDAPADPAAFAAANSAIERIPRSVDLHDAVARWDAPAGAIVVRSHLPGDAVRLPLPEAPSDICVAPGGVLYVALADRVHLHDLRGRWPDATVRLEGFAPWRIDADGDGLWVLERAGRLARLTGLPLPATTPQRDDYAPAVFRPDPENCCPPTLRLLPAVSWPAAERPVALAAHPKGGVALLSWLGDGDARVRYIDAASGEMSAPVVLDGARYAYSLAWLDAGYLAVRMPGRGDAPVFAPAPGVDRARPLGDVYPLAADALEAPFAHRLAGPPRYPLGTADAEPLLPLSIRNLARHGEAANFAVTATGVRAHLLDSGNATTVWHRLYAEASIPAGTAFIVWLAATNEAEPPPLDSASAWHPQAFGRDVETLAAAVLRPHTPRAAWQRAASELPGHPGLVPWQPQRDVRGLFSVLIQNPAAQVRRVVGRYLWVRVDLFGDGRSGPDIAALRAYASRFDYGEQYLPRVYRESVYGPPASAPGVLIGRLDAVHADALDAGGLPPQPLADDLEASGVRAALPLVRVEEPGGRWLLTDQAGPSAWWLARESGAIAIYKPRATRADFLSRFLAIFESVLTPLEDRIAASYLATDPVVAPGRHLEWLAGWIGIVFEPALPEDRRREWLTAAPALARWHGTKRGLALALDIATGGAVRGGEIVILEHFRLRRLLATLLGVDLAERHDPLLPGLHRSGNSIVGDTLILNDAETAELLALFRDEVATAAEDAAVNEFLGRLAHRATVLVHQTVSPQDLSLIRRIAETASPAHVQVRVETASWPLLVGIASLVGVDTYLGPPRLPRPARADVSALGMGDFMRGPESLDPRMAGAAAAAPADAQPLADAGPDRIEGFGRSFLLDGSRSRAAPGRSIRQYVWRRLPQIP